MYSKKSAINNMKADQTTANGGNVDLSVITEQQNGRRKSILSSHQEPGTAIKKMMKRVMKIEDLPDDWDESIYQNEYDG